MVVGMAKEMFSARLDSDLRDALAAEAAAERRSVSNMLELVLRERYSVGLRVDRPSVASVMLDEDVARRSAAVAPVVQTVGMRPHMKKHRPAVECSSRVFVDGVCPDCGQVA